MKIRARILSRRSGLEAAKIWCFSPVQIGPDIAVGMGKGVPDLNEIKILHCPWFPNYIKRWVVWPEKSCVAYALKFAGLSFKQTLSTGVVFRWKAPLGLGFSSLFMISEASEAYNYGEVGLAMGSHLIFLLLIIGPRLLFLQVGLQYR